MTSARETTHQVRIRDHTTGAIQIVFDDWESLEYEKRVNHPGLCQITLSQDHSAVPYFTLDRFVEVWRRPDGQSLYRDYTGLYRGGEYSTASSGLTMFTAYSTGLLDVLRRRILLGNAGTSYTAKSGVAETVLKAFVDEQCVSGAIFRAVTGLSVEADGAGGNSINVDRAWGNLLDVLQEFAGDLGGGDFDVDLTAEGATTFEFAWYDDQLGTDRTWGNGVNDPVVFGAEYGNVSAIGYGLMRLSEINAVVMGGRGQGGSRTTQTVTDATAIADSPLNRCEAFVNASNSSDGSTLTDHGSAELEERQAREALSFTILQSNQLQYGIDYFLGDLVTVRYDGTNYDKKVVAVRVSVDRQGEQVTLETADVPAR
ncbi:MAG: Gp37-like protein [Planctomycetota bacterium]|jgi:hypothetical protein